jgi:thiol-disulfide isomerase/thioredoxin
MLLRSTNMKLLLLVIAAAVGCKGGADRPPEVTARPSTESPAPARLPWIEDDYPAALARARADNKPLVIDMWAGWCHTCLSMQQYVLIDPSLQPLASRFVWLALDTEKPENAAVLERYPLSVWPTFFVVSPGSESVQARYLGAASASQFREFLREGERGHLDEQGTADRLTADDPLRQVRDGHRAAIAGDFVRAAQAYRHALAQAPSDWPRREDVQVAAIAAHRFAGQYEQCVDIGMQAGKQRGRSASHADLFATAVQCTAQLPADDARRRALLELAAAQLAILVDDPDAALSDDDRSDAMRIWREVLLALELPDRARAVAERQRVLVDRAAATAHSPQAAATYNWPRAEVYVFLGIGEALIADLKASEMALPRDYDPPYRLAWVYHRTGAHDHALAAATRARDLAYGPRKATVVNLIADIQRARGDQAGELAARRAAVEIYETLPAGQQQPAALARARQAMDSLANAPD